MIVEKRILRAYRGVPKIKPQDVQALDRMHKRKKLKLIPRATAEDKEDCHLKYGYKWGRRKVRQSPDAQWTQLSNIFGGY